MRLVSSRRSLIGAAVLVLTIGMVGVSGQPQGGPIAALQAAVAALQAQVAALAAAVAALQNQEATPEVWRLGVPATIIGTGQLIPSNYFFCSDAPFCASVINAFDTVSPDPKRVTRVRLMVADRTGSYGQGLFVAIEARSYDGTLQRVLSTATIDLETANQLEWIEVPIVDTDAAIIAVGEYLASHVTLGAAPSGNLNLKMHLRAEVETP